MPTMPDDRGDQLRHHLDAALDHLLAVRVALAGVPDADAPDLPDEALSAALAASDNYQAARAKVREALDALEAKVDGETWLMVLRLEEVLTARCTVAMLIAWRLGWMAGCRGRCGR